MLTAAQRRQPGRVACRAVGRCLPEAIPIPEGCPPCGGSSLHGPPAGTRAGVDPVFGPPNLIFGPNGGYLRAMQPLPEIRASLDRLSTQLGDDMDLSAY